MLGLAVGDALALPALFLTPAEIRRRFGHRGLQGLAGSDYHPPGSVSDDTQTTLAVAQAIIESGELGVDALGLASAARLVRWSKGANLDRAPDATVMRGINRLADGLPWRGSGDPGSKSAGALARAVPVGIAFTGSPSAIREMAQAACFPTHAHPNAVASFVATSFLISFGIQDIPAHRWLRELVAGLGDLAPEVAAKVSLAVQRRRASPERILPQIGEGWTADEVLAKAVYATLHHADDFRGAVLLAANSSGDTTATAALTGALIGSVRGTSAIPREWWRRVEGVKGLRTVAEKLARCAARRAA